MKTSWLYRDYRGIKENEVTRSFQNLANFRVTASLNWALSSLGLAHLKVTSHYHC